MAGFMTKLNGHIYEGMYPAAEALSNGAFAELNASGEVIRTGATKDTKLRIAQKTAQWGMPALRLTVTEVGKDEVWLVESEWDINDNVPYDETLYETQPGTLVRMHRPLVGEELITTMEKALYDALAEGGLVAPGAGGTVVSA